MGEFIRDRMPDPISHFESEDVPLVGPGRWKTGPCHFHGGSDSLRVNTASGGWCCMACGVKGGDVLAFHMQAYGLEFIEAARELGCWVDDGKSAPQQKPAPLPARAALQVLAFEATLAAVAAGNVARGVALSDADRERLMVSAGRINRITEAFA